MNSPVYTDLLLTVASNSCADITRVYFGIAVCLSFPVSRRFGLGNSLRCIIFDGIHHQGAQRHAAGTV